MTQACPKLLRALLVVPALLGCDIVQGFQDAGTALFPEQSTHLSTPGLRLVKGGYRRLGLAAGRELSVLARSTEGGSSLVVMRFANPEPCEIPEVGRFVASQNPNRAEAGIAYFHDDATQGTLHFADTACQVYDFELEEARLPVGETAESVIVWAAGSLLQVDPARGTKTTLSENVVGVITRAFSGRTLVRSGNQLEVFDADWKSQGAFGKDVSTVLKTRTGALYLDAKGLHRLSAGANNASTQDELLLKDVCDLNVRDDTWATFHSPCGGGVRALNQATGAVYELPVDADPLYLRLLPARGSPGSNPLTEPFWFVFLRNVSSSLGTLVVRDPAGAEHVLGENATLDKWDLAEETKQNYGHALVNVQGGLADYIYWTDKGDIRTLASNVNTRSNRLVVDWDGSTGKLAVVSGDRLQILAERVPQDGFEFADRNGEWTTLFHDLDGSSGRLSRIPGTLAGLVNTPPTAPFNLPALEEVAPSVGWGTAASLGALLPGTIFLARYDATTGTGRLAYENAELRFKATVDVGVSDYLVTTDYLLYTIPFGSEQGIWLSTGK